MINLLQLMYYRPNSNQHQSKHLKMPLCLLRYLMAFLRGLQKQILLLKDHHEFRSKPEWSQVTILLPQPKQLFYHLM